MSNNRNRYESTFTLEVRKKLGLISSTPETKEIYTAEPTGTPDPSRLPDTKIFRKVQIEEKDIPRTIVIANPIWACLFNKIIINSYLTNLPAMFLEFMAKGHRIFFWQENNGNVGAYEVKNKQEFELALDDIIPANFEDIKTFMLQYHHVKSSDLFIFDALTTTNFNALIVESFPILAQKFHLKFFRRNTFDLSDCEGMDEKTFIQLLDTYPRGALECLMISKMSPWLEFFITKFIEHEPQVTQLGIDGQLDSKKIASLKKGWCVKMIFNTSPNQIKEIKKNLDLSHLEVLETDILNSQDIVDIITLLNQSNTLKKLSLAVYEDFERIDVEIPMLKSSNPLETLIFDRIPLPSIEYEILKQHAASLISLDMDCAVGHDVILEKNDPPKYQNKKLEFTFSKLKEFHFSNSVNPVIASQVLLASNHLELLHFYDDGIENEYDKSGFKDVTQGLAQSPSLWPKLTKCYIECDDIKQYVKTLTMLFPEKIIDFSPPLTHLPNNDATHVIVNADEKKSSINNSTINTIIFEFRSQAQQTVQLKKIFQIANKYPNVKFIEIVLIRSRNEFLTIKADEEFEPNVPNLESFKIFNSEIDVHIILYMLLKNFLKLKLLEFRGGSVNQFQNSPASYLKELYNPQNGLRRNNQHTIHKIVCAVNLLQPSIGKDDIEILFDNLNLYAKNIFLKGFPLNLTEKKNHLLRGINHVYYDTFKSVTENLLNFFPQLIVSNTEIIKFQPPLTEPQRNISARIKDQKLHYEVQQYFHDKVDLKLLPHPSQYRLTISSSLQITAGVITPISKLPNDLIRVNIPLITNTMFNEAIKYYSSNAKIHCVSFNKAITHTPQMLPMLDVNDSILQMVANNEVIIEYSKEFSAYFVKLAPHIVYPERITPIHYILENQPAENDFLKKIHSRIAEKKFATLFNYLFIDVTSQGKEFLSVNPIKKIKQGNTDLEVKCSLDEIKKHQDVLALLVSPKTPSHLKAIELAVFCLQFTHQESYPQDAKGWRLFNYWMQNKDGACLERCLVFKKLSDLIGLDCHYEENNCHARVKVKINNKWQLIDLGGTTATLNIISKPFIIPDEKIHPPLSLMQLSKSSESKQSFETFDTFTHKWLADINQRKLKQGLLLMNSDKECLQWHSAMLDYTKSHNINFVYIDDLSKIRYKIVNINNNNTTFSIVPSPLINELKQFGKPNTNSIFAINWSYLKPGQIGIHSILLDDQRLFDQMPIPANVVLMGLLDKNQCNQMSIDFFSRYPTYQEFPLSISLPSPISFIETIPSGKKAYPVNLYDGLSWEIDLYGTFQIKQNRFSTLEGAFSLALENKYDGLELINAPKNNREFDLRLAETIKRKKFNDSNGVLKILPDNFFIKLTYKNYDFKGRYTVESYNGQTWEYVLNTETYQYFFPYYVSANNKLTASSGLLDKKLLSILVTSILSESQWARLIDHAKSNFLQIIFAKDEFIPFPFLNKKILATKELKQEKNIFDSKPTCSVTLLQTNDADYSLHRLQNEIKQCHVISVHQNQNFSDIFETVTFDQFDEKNSEIKYLVLPGTIVEWLKANATIILKGHFSKALCSRLETLFAKQPYLWINGEKVVISGKIILITEQESPFVAVNLNQIQKEKVSQDVIYQCLSKEFKENDCKKLILEKSSLENQPKSFVEFKTILLEQKNLTHRNPLRSRALLSKDPFQELKKIQLDFKVPSQKKDTQEDLGNRRIKKMLQMLNLSPYVLIAGPSGSGKSNIVLSELPEYYKKTQQKEIKLCSGMVKLQEWVNQTNSTIPTFLFIDANFTHEDEFNAFEGLYYHPPGIILNGKFHEIKPHQKIIFAGTFGTNEGLKPHTFFNRHGSVMLFNASSRAYLENSIVLPVLNKIFLQFKINLDSKVIAVQLVEYYLRFKSQYSKALLTPRNLHTMCFRLVQLLKLFNNIDQIIKLSAYNEVLHFLSAPEKAAEEKLLNITSAQQQLENTAAKDFKSPHYLALPSRYGLLRLLSEELEIRKIKSTYQTLANYGTRGMLIEGDSGAGKTSAVIAALKAKNFLRATIDNKESPPILEKEALGLVYCHIVPNGDKQQEIIYLLKEGFDRGWIFVIDEINTGFLQPILNELMTNRVDGVSPKRQGGYIIGTQNDATFAHREILLPTLENRFHKIKIQDYPTTELASLARFKQCPENKIAKAIELFQLRKKQAPIPLTTRYFIEEIVSSHRLN